MLLEIYRSMPRMQAQLEHLATTVDGTKKKVDELTSWQNRILGGVAVVAILWTVFKFLSGYVHIDFGQSVAPAPAAEIRQTPAAQK